LNQVALNFEEVIEAVRKFVAPVVRKDGIAIRRKPGKDGVIRESTIQQLPVNTDVYVH